MSTHRWLSGCREEVYSDWLAWTIERQRDAAQILPLFGLAGSVGTDETWTVEREMVTAYGRLDLLLRNAKSGMLCVEIKTESIPGEDQLERYESWLAGEHRLGLVLLAVDPAEDKPMPDMCRFCSWTHVARTLRVWASKWLSQRRMYDAVMTLAFCGAIEQNLLSLGGTGLNALRTAEYLEGVLEEFHATTT